MIPESHPLQQLFTELVGRHYAEEIGIRDPAIVGYVAHLLAEFCELEQLFKIRNAAGKPLTDVGEMLIESNPVYGPRLLLTGSAKCASISATTRCFLPACSRKASIISGLRHNRVENFIDWVKAGKESYYIVSKFEHFEYTKVRPAVCQPVHRFEECVYGLNRVKNDLQDMQHPIVRRSNDLIM
jgi:hypothetical protein